MKWLGGRIREPGSWFRDWIRSAKIDSRSFVAALDWWLTIDIFALQHRWW